MRFSRKSIRVVMGGERNLTKALLVFLVMNLAGFAFLYGFYQYEKNQRESHTRDILSIKAKEVQNFVSDFVKSGHMIKSGFGMESGLDKENYPRAAKLFMDRHPYTLAFNLLNESFTFVRAFPRELNKKILGKDLRNHPDPEVQKVYRNLIGNEKVIMLPPVNLIQGKKGITFTLPLVFNNGERGALNLVLFLEEFLSEVFLLTHNQKIDLSFYDLESKRFYYGTNTLNNANLVKSIKKIFDREVVFIGDFSQLMTDLNQMTFFLALFMVLVFSLSAYTLYHYLQKNSSFQKNLLSANSERNLLLVVLHDLASPMMVMGMDIDKLNRESDENKRLIRLKKACSQANEILGSVRDLHKLSDGVDAKKGEFIDLKNVLEGSFKKINALSERDDLKLKIENNWEQPVKVTIPSNILTNEVLGNIVRNIFKFSKTGSTVTGVITDRKIIIFNEADPIPKKVMKEINTNQRTSPSESMEGSTGLGLGLLIAKIFTLNHGISLHLSQDSAGMVRTELEFQKI